MGWIPDDLRHQVIRTIYKRMDDLHWEQLQDDQRSGHYAAFVEDPAIGGVLLPYRDESGIRVWIKDGPAKEYRRAIQGVGPYAEYTNRQLTGADRLIEQALGQGWSVVPGSIKDKPMRCAVEDVDGSRVTAIWGPLSSFKDLFWHAAVTLTDKPAAEVSIIITKPATAALPGWDRYQRLASLINATCYQVTQSVTRKSTQGST
jgi:hypothetical protein